MSEILDLTIPEALDYLDAWSELTQPDKPKKAIVLRKPKSVIPAKAGTQ